MTRIIFILFLLTSNWLYGQSNRVIDSISTYFNYYFDPERLENFEAQIDLNINKNESINYAIFQTKSVDSLKNYLKSVKPDFTGAIQIWQMYTSGMHNSYYMSFKNGIPHGKWNIEQFLDVHFSGYYNAGIRDSIWSLSEGTGNGDRYFFSGPYVNGKKEGVWGGANDADAGGGTKVTYKNGIKHGLATIEYYCCDEGSYISGEYLEGIDSLTYNQGQLVAYSSNKFFKNGKLKSKEQRNSFELSNKNNCNEYYHPCLQIPMNKSSEIKYWDKNGKLIKMETFESGKLINEE